ncbi:MAG TPA: hypothetical protein VHB30_05715 [Solirubrobacteraceae bacterium]|nr:hypothetical protein [Solirubrobacteraceae bacterium]
MSDRDAARGVGEGGSTEALTFAFGDGDARLFGVARLGLADGLASGLAVVFRDGEPIAVRADGGVEPAGASWDEVRAAGLETATTAPGAAWALRFAGGDDDAGAFELAFEATSPPIELGAQAPAARAGGMEGVDRVCRVRGTVAGEPFEGLGQRGRSWGMPDWERMSLTRTLSAWLDGRHAVTLAAVRPAGARNHDEEAVSAFVLDAEAEEPVAPVREALLSTAYDEAGRQRRAGLELYLPGDDRPRRAAGEVVAGTSLDLGRLRLDCAFFRWRMEGRAGVGRYDVLRRA